MTQSAATPPPSSPPAGPPAGAKPKKPRADKESSVKETIESILVAFILAFIFRAFVVEAFVIPTGSMAPTLLGAHMRFRCNDCGYRFDVNYSSPPTRDGEVFIGNTADLRDVVCPNCGYSFPMMDSVDPENAKTHHPVNYGDRILVLKYQYLFREPRRWDVVVFKSPDKEANGEPPTYTTNYIKRLIGKPGESIMILDGDIYKGDAGTDLAGYTVQTKPRYAQDALWRVIYDNDYYPVGVEGSDGRHFRQPWTIKQGTGWDLGSAPAAARTFRFNNTSGESTLFFDRDANPNNHALTDWLAYDIEAGSQGNVVHDLKLAFFYDRAAGDGPLRVNLSDGRQTFAAILTPGEAKLVQLNSDGETVIGSVKLSDSHDPIHVELSNADYQVTLRLNDAVVAQTTPQQYHPDVVRLLADFNAGRPQPWPSVEISASNQTAALSHIGLWRDVYYLNRGTTQSGGPYNGSPKNPINLGPEEYFVLGDNSLISGDARYWSVPIDLPADRLQVQAGRVPGRFLLGRAFFVYWPAGFRPAQPLPALAPNFGDMRFIR